MITAPHIRLILWKTAKAVERIDLASISDTGLQLSEFAIMELLLHKGPQSINAIGSKVLLTSGSMTAAVNRLERKRLVRREKNPTDGRSFKINLSEQGQRVIRTAFDTHQRNLEKMTRELDAQERETLVRLLKKLGLRAEQMMEGQCYK